jgi:hypothetical protein
MMRDMNDASQMNALIDGDSASRRHSEIPAEPREMSAAMVDALGDILREEWRAEARRDAARRR